jgi:hypothetical protein
MCLLYFIYLLIELHFVLFRASLKTVFFSVFFSENFEISASYNSNSGFYLNDFFEFTGLLTRTYARTSVFEFLNVT